MQITSWFGQILPSPRTDCQQAASGSSSFFFLFLFLLQNKTIVLSGNDDHCFTKFLELLLAPFVSLKLAEG